MDLSLTQVQWSGSFQLQHAKALCLLAGILRQKREKSDLAFAPDEAQRCDPELWRFGHSRATTSRSIRGQSDKGDFEDRAHMRSRDCVWRQPSDADCGP